MTERVLVIGLDGATFDVIRPLVREGRLPHIARLLERGTSGVLMSTVPPTTPPAWTSFMTGKNPAKHGVFDFMHHARSGPGDELRFVSYGSIATPTLWDILTHKDKRMVLVNVPVTYPPPPINGVVISGLMTPNESSNFVHPKSLQERLVREGYRVDFHPLIDVGSRKKEEWLRDYFDIEERRLQVAAKLIRDEPWDFFMIVVGVTDRIQHFCWTELPDPIDGNGPLSGSVPRAYELADRMVGTLLREIDDRTLVLVISDHGFGTVDHVFFTNCWLRDNGFLSLKSLSLQRWQETHAFRVYRVKFGNLLTRFGLGSLSSRVPPFLADSRVALPLIRRKVSPSVVDWDKTVAYADTFGIYINRKGRETHGTVEPGTEYETIRDRIISRLQDLRDPRTGEALVDIAVRREQVYSGPHLEAAPDVLFQIKNLSYLLNRSFYFRRMAIPTATGNHRMEGILLTAGPGVKEQGTVTGANITDIAPTILYTMGLPVPDDMDGRVLDSVFHPDQLRMRPVLTESPLTIDREVTHDVYSADDVSTIRASLTALGYLS